MNFETVQVKVCFYRDEKYSVREDGCIMRHSRENQRRRKLDEQKTILEKVENLMQAVLKEAFQGKKEEVVI